MHKSDCLNLKLQGSLFVQAVKLDCNAINRLHIHSKLQKIDIESVWNETSKSITTVSTNDEALVETPRPAKVESVERNSIAEELGFEPGDKLVRINNTKPRDLIDYKYLIAEEELNLEVLDKKGKLHKIHLEKDLDDDLGLVFSEALFDGLKQCNNNCSFCFIDQQPLGHRKTLYLKDDDYRMSFLYGSYLTLTNLMAKDWLRIETQRLSPLFVSVHSTDSKLRSKLLKNPRAGLIMEQINWFKKKNLQLHAQVVVCPGLNDDENLTKTLNDLFTFSKGKWPTILSTAIVPVGLTRFRPENDGLIPVDEECATKVIDQVEKLQTKFEELIGSRFAWLSDEWYLLAKKPLPPRILYESLPQEENGVGSIRSFLENIEKATANLPSEIPIDKTCSWVVGSLVVDALQPICKKINKIKRMSLTIIGLESPYWGKEKVVTGLLTGQDLIDGLSKKNLGEELYLPSIMLKHGESKFLDDITVEEVSKTLKTSIKVVFGPDDFVKKVLETTYHAIS